MAFTPVRASATLYSKRNSAVAVVLSMLCITVALTAGATCVDYVVRCGVALSRRDALKSQLPHDRHTCIQHPLHRVMLMLHG